MSVILITDHNENITNIGDGKEAFSYKETTAKLKTLKRHKVVRTPIKHVIKAHATMGVPEGQLVPDPCEYLKKHTGHVAYTGPVDSKEKHICRPKEKLFPTLEEIAQYNKSKKDKAAASQNFLRKNIKTVVNLKPKDPEPRVAVDHHGETKRLSDGLEPIYIKSSSFGKTPQYLKQFIKKRQQLYQMQKDAIGVEQPKCRYIRKDEREELLKVVTGLVFYNIFILISCRV